MVLARYDRSDNLRSSANIETEDTAINGSIALCPRVEVTRKEMPPLEVFITQELDDTVGHGYEAVQATNTLKRRDKEKD